MVVRLKAISTRVKKLADSVDRRFEQVDKRFEQVDKRFEQVDQRFVELQQLIVTESEKTRRHFDIAVEHVKAERNLVIDKSMATDDHLVQLRVSNAAAHVRFESRLDDHERRLKALEPDKARASTDSGEG